MIHSKVLASVLIAIGTLAAVMPAAAQRGDGDRSSERDRRRDGGGQDRDRESRGGYEQRGEVQGSAPNAENGSVSDRPRYQPRQEAAPQQQQQQQQQSGDWRNRNSGGQRDGNRYDGGGQRDGNRNDRGGRGDGGWNGGNDGGRRDYDRNDGRRGDGRWDGDRRDGNRYDGRRDGGRDWNDRRNWNRNDWNNDWSRRGWNSRYSHRDYRRDWHSGRAWRRYDFGSRYVRPYGWRDFRWTIGLRLPSVYYVPNYYIDWRAFDLAPPPYGYRWIRVESDAYLVETGTGQILDIVYDLFY